MGHSRHPGRTAAEPESDALTVLKTRAEELSRVIIEWARDRGEIGPGDIPSSGRFSVEWAPFPVEWAPFPVEWARAAAPPGSVAHF